MDDDVWAEDGEVPTEADTARARHHTLGMREGILQGSDAMLQAQFDRGYKDGAELALRLGKIIGILQQYSPELEAKLMAEVVEKSKTDIRQIDLDAWSEIAAREVEKNTA